MSNLYSMSLYIDIHRCYLRKTFNKISICKQIIQNVQKYLHKKFHIIYNQNVVEFRNAYIYSQILLHLENKIIIKYKENRLSKDSNTFQYMLSYNKLTDIAII